MAHDVAARIIDLARQQCEADLAAAEVVVYARNADAGFEFTARFRPVPNDPARVVVTLSCKQDRGTEIGDFIRVAMPHGDTAAAHRIADMMHDVLCVYYSDFNGIDIGIRGAPIYTGFTNVGTAADPQLRMRMQARMKARLRSMMEIAGMVAPP